MTVCFRCVVGSLRPAAVALQLVERPGVVALQHRDPVLAERERGHRRRRHDDALEQVEVHAGVVRDRGLDRIGVRHDHDELAGMVGDHGLERGDHPRLHRGERLARRGTTRATGVRCTTFQRSVLARSTSFCPVHSP